MMNANNTLETVTIARLRADMARAHATEYRALVVLRNQLLQEVNSKLYGKFPRKEKVKG